MPKSRRLRLGRRPSVLLRRRAKPQWLPRQQRRQRTKPRSQQDARRTGAPRPHRCGSKPAPPRDVYAFGMLIYEAAFRKNPFHDFRGTIGAHVMQRFDPKSLGRQDRAAITEKTTTIEKLEAEWWEDSDPADGRRTLRETYMRR